MTERARVDPLRVIVDVKKGAGCDTLTLDCGHSVSRDTRHKWGKRTRCHTCRFWNDNMGVETHD